MNFVVRYFLPVFQYLFIAGLIGAIPVIIITAIRTAESMLEDETEFPLSREEADHAIIPDREVVADEVDG